MSLTDQFNLWVNGSQISVEQEQRGLLNLDIGANLIAGRDGFSGRLMTWDAVKRFVFAGNATVTIRSTKTGTRFTYRVRARKADKGSGEFYFVSLMRGPDNEDDFQYMGVIQKGEFRRTSKSRISLDAASMKAFVWFMLALSAGGAMHPMLEIWHEGRCGRCNRKLTVPESIAAGLGPECAGRM